MSLRKTLTLNTGAKIPQLGLGTWLSKPGEVKASVLHAVKSGYRHLDLARVYQNQEEVGAALKELIPAVVKREELFITSKLWNNSHQEGLVEVALDETLAQLGLTYLDLYLIHWPCAFQPGEALFPPDKTHEGFVTLDTETPLTETWKAMIKLPHEKVRAIGVSNFSIPHIEGIIKATGVTPAMNQIEAHPYLPQEELRAYCEKHGILITAYSPLGNNLLGKPKLVEQDAVKTIADELGATPAQVLVAWAAHRGYAVIPKSVQPARIESNFVQVELSEDAYARISALGDGNYTRFNIPLRYVPKWDINIFGEPEEKEATHLPKV